MSTKLYDILFEDTTTKKAPDLKARLSAMQQKGKTTATPSGKVELHPHQILSGMQDKIKNEIPAISKLIKDPDPSKDDIKAAKKALDDVDNSVDAIANFQGFAKEVEASAPKEKAVEPQPEQAVSPTAKTEPQAVSNIGTARTQPQMPVAKTQQVPQADIEDIMRQQANMRAYPNAQRQAEIDRARMQGATTQVLPSKQPSVFQRLRQRVGLEEAIKQAIKEGLKNQ